MNGLPPINARKIHEILSKLKSFPEINKYYGDWLAKALNEPEPRTYPIIKQFLTSNWDYLALLEQVLTETSVVKGFPTIIKHSKNKSEFYDEFSILKLGRILRNRSHVFEFLPQAGQPQPDLKAKIWGKEVFFEVKHIRDIEEASNSLFDYFNEYPSRVIVSIQLDNAVTMSQVEECIKKIRESIEGKKDDDFPQHLPLSYANIEIRLSRPRSRTPIIVSKGPEIIPFERTKFKIGVTFQEALEQFNSIPLDSPCFIVYDVDNWKIDFEDLGSVLYGNAVTDLSLITLELQKTLYSSKEENREVHDKQIVWALARGFWEVLRNNVLIPEFSYSYQDGLFFTDKSSEINGVIAFGHNEQKLFPNPFVKDERLVKYSELRRFFPT